MILGILSRVRLAGEKDHLGSSWSATVRPHVVQNQCRHQSAVVVEITRWRYGMEEFGESQCFSGDRQYLYVPS